MDSKSSPPRPGWREIVQGIGMAGCFVAGGAIGLVLVIVGVFAIYAGSEQVAGWLADVLGERGMAALFGGGFLVLGVVGGIALLRQGPTPDVGFPRWLLALVVMGGFVVFGVAMLIFVVAPGSDSRGF
jgi:hypothetical protein